LLDSDSEPHVDAEFFQGIFLWYPKESVFVLVGSGKISDGTDDGHGVSVIAIGVAASSTGSPKFKGLSQNYGKSCLFIG